MASPFPHQAPLRYHEPAHFLPEDWSDTDQRIIETLLLKSEAAPVPSPSPLSTSFAFSGQPAQEPPARKKRGSRKRVTAEEKKMKHREVQRRFMQRKKQTIAAVKSSILELEKQVQLLQLSSERAALESEQAVLRSQAEATKPNPGQRLEALERVFESEAKAVEKLFQPFTVERWEELVCQTMGCVDSILTRQSMQTVGMNVMGWSDHRNVEDTSVKFTLHKEFPNVCAEEIWQRSWERLTTDCYASFFSPALLIRKHLLQRVCDDAIIIYRVICYPQTGRISRAIEVISRVRREHDFVYFVRTLDLPAVKEQLGDPGAWTQSLTVLRFMPSDPVNPDMGCVVQYGGNYVSIPRGGVKYWLMEILFLVLRFESTLISPMFALGN
ncbi:hypothetical protein BBJ28_00005041 [Nothophytophthora sp. Chile5]|nr:hypothetical protein BBJ28_00005041 [Nothophytophthora sp. Chile5]